MSNIIEVTAIFVLAFLVAVCAGWLLFMREVKKESNKFVQVGYDFLVVYLQMLQVDAIVSIQLQRKVTK